MDDAIADIRHELHMLRIVTANLWSNYLANGSRDPIEECQRAEDGILDALTAAAAQVDLPNVRDLTEPLHQKLQDFWDSVERQVRMHPRVADRLE